MIKWGLVIASPFRAPDLAVPKRTFIASQVSVTNHVSSFLGNNGKLVSPPVFWSEAAFPRLPHPQSWRYDLSKLETIADEPAFLASCLLDDIFIKHGRRYHPMSNTTTLSTPTPVVLAIAVTLLYWPTVGDEHAFL